MAELTTFKVFIGRKNGSAHLSALLFFLLFACIFPFNSPSKLLQLQAVIPTPQSETYRMQVKGAVGGKMRRSLCYSINRSFKLGFWL